MKLKSCGPCNTVQLNIDHKSCATKLINTSTFQLFNYVFRGYPPRIRASIHVPLKDHTTMLASKKDIAFGFFFYAAKTGPLARFVCGVGA